VFTVIEICRLDEAISKWLYTTKIYRNSKAITITSCGDLQACELLRIPHFLDGSQMVVRLSALCTGHALPPEISSGYSLLLIEAE
jgi:hypothetical protein